MAYLKRRSLTVDHTQCGAANSTDFPVLVRVTNLNFALIASGGHVNNSTTSNGQTVPADLAFFSDQSLATVLKFEIESWNSTTGALVAWVKIPTLSHTADTVFYVGYDDPAVTTFQGDVNGTWNSNFKGVWHLPNGTTLAAADSTSGLHTGAITNTAAIAGAMDGGADFGGPASPSRISLGASADWGFAGSFTCSCWFKTGTTASAFMFGISGFTTAFELNQRSTPGVQWVAGNMLINQSVTVADSQWHQAVGQFDAGSGTGTIYFDGALGATSAAGFVFTPNITTVLTLGDDALNQGSIAFTGQLDEFHVNASLLSADWILSEYNNQVPGSTFLTLGSQEVTVYTLSAGSGAYTVTGTRTRLIWSGAATGQFAQCMNIAIMGL